MDIMTVFEKLKKGAVDVATVDFVKQAYVTQQQNIEQLQRAWDLCRNDVERLKNRVAELEDESSRLRATNEALTRENDGLKSRAQRRLSKPAARILECFSDNDTTVMYEGDIERLCGLACIETRAGIDELCDAKLLEMAFYDSGDGARYGLTSNGTRVLREVRERQADPGEAR